jgi:hypothetical protein
MIPAHEQVLTEAIVLKTMKVGAELVDVTYPNPVDPEGEPLVGQEWDPVFVKPGERIDVTGWANVDAYVRQGFIHMVTPEVEVRLRGIAAASESHKTDTAAAQANRRQTAGR